MNGAGGNVKSCEVVKNGAKVVRVVVTLVAQRVAYTSVLVGEMTSSCLEMFLKCTSLRYCVPKLLRSTRKYDMQNIDII